MSFWKLPPVMFAYAAMSSAEYQREVMLAQVVAQDAALAEQMRQFSAYRAIGQQSLRRISLAAPPACNCRNCGAPFEPAATRCSYCRSER